MNDKDTQPIFLKIRGGWINPIAILSVETHRDNDAMLNLHVAGYERPIPLNEADSGYISKYLESRTWQPAKDEELSIGADDGESNPTVSP